MLYYNDDSGLSGVPLAPQRKRMSTHLLEDMTQAQRLELFLHHLPAQITSFPIGTEISSSTLCQQLTEELGVRLIDLNPFRDEVAQVARAVITRLQEAVEEENEEEAIESAVEDRGGEQGGEQEGVREGSWTYSVPTFWHTHTRARTH